MKNWKSADELGPRPIKLKSRQVKLGLSIIGCISSTF
jgi:hypothetical protein